MFWLSTFIRRIAILLARRWSSGFGHTPSSKTNIASLNQPQQVGYYEMHVGWLEL